MRKIAKVILVSTFLCFSFTVHAATITVFNALMDGDQANAGNGTGSAGIGAGTMTLDMDTGLFEWFIGWQDLTGNVTNAHFHGPAPAGMNAGVEVGIDFTTNPTAGSAFLTAQQMVDVMAGLWYVNIHSDFAPGGEIRGQVLAVGQIPLPAAVWLLASALIGLAGTRKRK